MFLLETHSGDFWADFWSIATDPAHLLFELLFSLVFDILIVTVFWGVLIKKVIIPRIKKDVHAEIDLEHGIEH